MLLVEDFFGKVIPCKAALQVQVSLYPDCTLPLYGHQSLVSLYLTDKFL